MYILQLYKNFPHALLVIFFFILWCTSCNKLTKNSMHSIDEGFNEHEGVNEAKDMLVNKASKHGDTPLHIAAEIGNEREVRNLLNIQGIQV